MNRPKFLTRRRKSPAFRVKLLHGLDMTLGEFFNAPVFDELEQEIK